MTFKTLKKKLKKAREARARQVLLSDVDEVQTNILKEFVSNQTDRRLKDNLTIIKKLAEYATANPDQRFGQILRNTGVIMDHFVGNEAPRWSNHFNEEPNKMIKRMIETEEFVKRSQAAQQYTKGK